MPVAVLARVLAASLWAFAPQIELAPPDLARATVSGRITDAGTGEALTGARVFISGQTTSVLSGDGGEYSFILPGDGWDGREVEVRAEMPGYQSFVRTVRLSGPTTRVDLAMMGLVMAITVVGLKIVGLILIVALLIIPAVTARFWSDRAERVVILAGLFGGFAGYVGAALSASAPNLPTGPIIVLISFALFLISLFLAPNRGVLAAAVVRGAALT